MKFETYFRAASYAMISCGALALAVSGGMGLFVGALFAAALVTSWKLEGTRRQLSERAGLVVVLTALPLFYLDWKLQGVFGSPAGPERTGVAALVHLTLFLSAVKLLQVKADRDWIFLYLISFFEVLLAAGLSISPVYLASLALYLFGALLTIVCFEVRKARRVVPQGESRLLAAEEAGPLSGQGGARRARALRRMPLVAVFLLALIFVLALPIFFVTPRSGSGMLTMAGGAGSTGYVGFSDQVTLGDIGRLQQSNQLVMRVRVEGSRTPPRQYLRWRGIALDRFTGRTWSQSLKADRIIPGNPANLFKLGTTEDLDRLTTQTFFLEPIDTPVLFAAPRAVAVQGALPYIKQDSEDGLVSRPHAQERITYRALSDTVEPPPERLRADRRPYPRDYSRYLQLPETLDTGIASLAWLVAERAGAGGNRYDTARAVEAHLSENAYGGGYGYTLQMRAGGADPLADFLLRVRAGHCEYFSSAMAVMLRTQGIAARVVNGFQSGDFNSAADAYIVRQSNAHSWVEVYFPETDSWVTFDPTPAAGRPAGGEATGLRAQLQMYSEALELFWIQYVVAYDKQEQRTLVRSMRGRLNSYRDSLARAAGGLRSSLAAWWRGPGGSGAVGPTAGAQRSFNLGVASLAVAGLLVSFFLLRRRGFTLRRGTGRGATAGRGASTVVNFYERMARALELRGLKRAADQTPLEFAHAVGTHEALTITEAYHRVRYGARHLSDSELEEVEACLRRVEEAGESKALES